MKTWQRAATAVALAGVAVAGAAGVSAAVSGSPAAVTRPAKVPTSGSSEVTANIRVVKSFVQDVLNNHNGGDAGNYMTTDASWSGGTVGTITGGPNVAGLFASVVTALPNLHATIDDAFGQGNEVVVRMVVSGTQDGAILGIPASGRNVQWDAIDVFRLHDGKINAIWAGDDWTAILNDTGTYKAPWIP